MNGIVYLQDTGLLPRYEVSLNSDLYQPRGSNTRGYHRIYYLCENGLGGISLSNALEYSASAWPHEQCLHTISSMGRHRAKMSFRLCIEGQEPFSIQKGVSRVKNGRVEAISMGKAVQCAGQVVERWLVVYTGPPTGAENGRHSHRRASRDRRLAPDLPLPRPTTSAPRRDRVLLPGAAPDPSLKIIPLT